MNKFRGLSILFISIFIFENITSFIFLIFKSQNYSQNFDGVILWNFWRLLFFGLPYLLFFSLSYKYFKNIKIQDHLVLSIFNLFFYLFISILIKIIWGKNIPLPLNNIMFLITCLSILVSPIILGKIPFFRNLMKSIFGNGAE